jgi:hypothetical protein
MLRARSAIRTFHPFPPKKKKAPRRYKISLKPLLGALGELLLIRPSRRIGVSWMG